MFLNAISHDLRTPLNGIALQTHVIDRAIEAKDPTILTGAVGEIRSASTLAAEILDALLQYAHTDIDQPVFSTVDVKTLLTQTADPFRAAAEEKQLVFTLAAPAHLQIETDPNKLQRLFANLVGNAVKFTKHGSITITAKAVEGGGGDRVDLRAVDGTPPVSRGGEKSLVIEVQDTGCGIPLEDQARLFKEFYQANNPSRDARLGLGLGLVIAKRLAQQLGGTLTFTSVPGQGSTFTLRLPARG
jgi:signal transduction histidine kinase